MRIAFLLLFAIPLWSQEQLTLRDAVRLALKENGSIASASAAVSAADSRIAEAASGRLPRVQYSESFTRSNNPVFVFSSLLTQHEFSATNFDIGRLNQPDFLNNFQSQLTLEQPVYDAGQTRLAMKSARLARSLTAEDRRRTELDVISGVVRSYNAVLLATESLKTAEQAVRSAEADLRRAESVRAAGMATDVDVLSIRVHMASVTEQRIKRAADLDVARAALNDALGLPLDTSHQLSTQLTRIDIADDPLEAYEKNAVENRPELRQTKLASNLADVYASTSRSAYLPKVSVQSAFEADRQTFVTRGGANWAVGVSLKWNLFNGFADKERIAEAGHLLAKARADERRADSGVRLEVRHAWADLRSSEQRIETAKAAVAESEESLRITQNRYEAGMSTVTDLLRNETAVLESRTRYLAAIHDQRIAATSLELAAGRLNPDSEVLN